MLKLILLMALAFRAHADTGAAHSIVLQPVADSALAIQMGDGFLNADALASDDPYRGFFEHAPHAGETIYHGRAEYDVNIAPAKLNADFFENISEFQKLIGKRTQLTLVTQKPFVFTNSVSAALGLVHVTSTGRLLVREYGDLKPGFVDGVLRRTDKPIRILMQNCTGFSAYFDQAFMLTLIYPNGKGGTHIENISAVVIDQFPPLGGHGAVSNVSRKSLVTYANNLAGEKL